MTTQVFKLEKITCPSCVSHLEAMEDDLDGVDRVDVNYKKQHMQVAFDEDKLSVEKIVAAVGAMGYVAKPDSDAGYNEKKGAPWKRLFR